MAIINLRDFYPFYNSDMLIEVHDDIAAALMEADRVERNYLRRMFYNKAHYSLDTGDGIEHEAVFRTLTPCEVYERKLTMQQLCAALNTLPPAQARRVYAHYILGNTETEIARAEGMSVSAVCTAIERGLKNMETILKKMD